MIIGKRDKDLVESLKLDIATLQNSNDLLVKNVVRLTNNYLAVASIDNLLSLSGLSVVELSNISGVNLEEFLDSDEAVTPELYNSILRSLIEFFLRYVS